MPDAQDVIAALGATFAAGLAVGAWIGEQAAEARTKRLLRAQADLAKMQTRLEQGLRAEISILSQNVNELRALDESSQRVIDAAKAQIQGQTAYIDVLEKLNKCTQKMKNM